MLIAAVIAVLALGVLFEAGATGLRATRSAALYDQAISRARSRLAIATRTASLAPGDWQGEDGGGFHWHVRVWPAAATTVRPVGAAGAGGPASFRLTLYNVAVSVAWREGETPHAVQLQTAQLGALGR